MKKSIRGGVAGPRILAAALMAMAVLRSLDAAAQAQPADVDRMVKYAQCIRANGYPEFPDPSPDGRMQLKLDPRSGAQFEAAQRACKDKLPAGLATADQPMTPERMQTLLGFAKCMRGKGVNGFPDPSPKGVFEFTSAATDMSTPQAQKAMNDCRQSNPVNGLMIRMAPPK